MRNEILAQLHRNATTWFTNALTRAPIEFQAALQVRSQSCLIFEV